MISSRPYPELFHKSTITVPLVDGLDRGNAREATGNCLVLYKDKTSRELRLLQRSHVLCGRPVLCCVKRVYGGAFSGYPASTNDTGNSVLDILVLEAQKCKFKPSKTIEARRRQLHRSAENVTNMIKEMLGDEVRKHLNRIASLLMGSDAKSTWHMLGNNCQRLIDRLLTGKDFEYTFPRLPKGFGPGGSTDIWKNLPWLWYLISFGDRVEGKDISIPQPNSSVTKFCHKTSSDGDIIDFLELEIQRAGRNGGNSCFKDLSELALVIPQPGSENYCELSNNALWDLPRDSLSILQYHLIRPSSRYSTTSGQAFDETQWSQSRLRALQQLDTIASYTGALGSALLDLFHREPNIASKVAIPKSRIFGSLRADEKARIIRSGNMVGYVISRRQERLTEALGHAEKKFNAIRMSLEKFCVAVPRTSLLLLMQAHKSLESPEYINFIRLYADVFRLGGGALGSLGSVGAVTDLAGIILACQLQAIKIANRDNWIYMKFGDVIFAYQLLRKSKSTRKEPREGNPRKPVTTE